MPDILIRGYSMPASCATRHFNNNMFCDVLGLKIKFPVDYIERPGACPLHELPPHGDLIDVRKSSLQEYEQAAHDALHNGKGSILYDCGVLAGARAITQFVRRAPVVVPAEREGKA